MTEGEAGADGAFIESPFGIKVPLGPHLGQGHRLRIQSGGYEGEEVAGVGVLIQPGDRVLECGAGIGLVGALTVVSGAAEAVLSFEGNPRLIEPIRALHALNGLQERMEVRHQILLAGPDQPASIRFNVRGNFLGSRLADSSERGHMIEVATADYATVKAEFRPNVILMDIEGGELEFLKHADLSGIRGIIIEFHPQIYDVPGMRACKDILRGQGFEPMPGSSRSVWAAARALS